MAAAESHVAQLVAQWSNNPHETNSRLASVEVLVELGKTYEEALVADTGTSVAEQWLYFPIGALDAQIEAMRKSESEDALATVRQMIS